MKKPPFRKLRGYAFDPSLSQQAATADINSIVYKVAWEELVVAASDDELYNPNNPMQGKGPIGEYIEVIDYDPTVKRVYAPVDLNDPYILAQDGLAPSESNPQFHQQMVYAVIMTTIRNFETALGRKILWAPRRVGDGRYFEYVPRLRVYPHAFRGANAYYSPLKKSLLFGYFSSTPADASLQMPGTLVFTCLSHDVIAHETTHAILDSMYRHYTVASNPDVLAFHEAFADIVALFQHFTFPEVLKSQIAETRGDLGQQNLLGKLAQQFGTAIGGYGSLRDAIGEIDKSTGQWRPKAPSPNDYRTIMEPHERGSILVAAIFEAYINIYKSQVQDLLRIASNGSGVLPEGELHPDLVNRLAREASKVAGHVLTMCVRALDYCPPVDITFGDYLRAIITADINVLADDSRNYRLYFIDAFRRRGIYPQGIKNLSAESLQFRLEPEISLPMQGLMEIIIEFLKDYRKDMMYIIDRRKIYETSSRYMGGEEFLSLHRRLTLKFEGSIEFERLTGIVFSKNWKKLGIRTSKTYGEETPSFQVQGLRLVSRVGPDNSQINEIIFSIVQRSGVLMWDGEFREHFQPKDGELPDKGIIVYGGCTLIFDLDTLRLKYAISRPLLDMLLLEREIRQIDRARIANQYHCQTEVAMHSSEFERYFGVDTISKLKEPFAFLHQF